MIAEILCVILFIIVGTMAFIISNLNKKIVVYERWVSKFHVEVNQMYSRLKAVDDRNLFEKDDDVGFIFSEIVRVAKEFNETIQ